MSILEDLAAGRIDAAEAARRIEALKNESPENGTSEQEQPADAAGEFDRGRPQFATHAREVFREPEPEPEPAAASEPVDAEVVDEPTGQPTEESADEQVPPRTATGTRGVNKVIIRAVGRRVRVVGDTAVATLSADGPHVLRRTGKTLEVTSDGEIGPSFGSFSIVRPPRSIEDLRTLGFGKELVVRVNPAIPVDVEVTGGGLAVTGVPVIGKLRVTVGSCNVDGIVEVEDALIQTGSATFRGDISQGRSRIRVESGSLTVTLGRKANVAVHADSQLGRVAWPGEQTGRIDEYVAGNGAARLDIGVVMGHASVKDENDEPAAQ